MILLPHPYIFTLAARTLRHRLTTDNGAQRARYWTEQPWLTGDLMPVHAEDISLSSHTGRRGQSFRDHFPIYESPGTSTEHTARAATILLPCRSRSRVNHSRANMEGRMIPRFIWALRSWLSGHLVRWMVMPYLNDSILDWL
jgi:hypothetical protein